MSDLIKVFPGATQEQPASSPGRIYETLNYIPMRCPGTTPREFKRIIKRLKGLRTI